MSVLSVFPLSGPEAELREKGLGPLPVAASLAAAARVRSVAKPEGKLPFRESEKTCEINCGVVHGDTSRVGSGRAGTARAGADRDITAWIGARQARLTGEGGEGSWKGPDRGGRLQDPGNWGGGRKHVLPSEVEGGLGSGPSWRVLATASAVPSPGCGRSNAKRMPPCQRVGWRSLY